VAELGLPVVTSRPPHSMSGAAPELDPDHRVAAAVRDEGARPVRSDQRRLPPLDRRTNPEKRGCRPRGPVDTKGHRVAHHAAHREAAEHGPLRPHPVSSRGGRAGGYARGRRRRSRVGIADARHQVPVVTGRAGQGQRGAGVTTAGDRPDREVARRSRSSRRCRAVMEDEQARAPRPRPLQIARISPPG